MAAPTLTPLETIRILLLEDNQADADLCIRKLRSSGLQAEVDVARFSQEFMGLVRAKIYEVILADYRLPDWNGLDAFNWLRSSGHYTPFVLVTGTLGDELAIECIKAGVSDYVLKENLERLPVAVRRALEEQKLRQSRDQAEEALAREHILLRTLIENMPDYLYAKDTKHRFLLANKALARRMGAASPDELLNKSDFDFYAPDLAAKHAQDEQQIMQSGQPVIDREESTIDATSGQIVWHTTTEVPLRDQNGNVLGLLGIGHTITERKRAEEELRKSEQRWRAAFDNASVGITLMDSSLHYVDVNAAYERMLGYRADELRSMTCFDLTVDEDRDGYKILFDELRNGKRDHFELEKRYRRKNGEPIWARVTGSTFRVGESQVWIEIAEDITERKRAEDELKSQKENLQKILDLIPAMVWSALPDGFIDFANQRWLEYFGYTFDKVRGSAWTDKIHPEEHANTIAEWHAALAKGEPIEIEMRLQRADGEYRRFVTHAVPLRDELGNIAKWYGTKTDVEDRRRAEEYLRESKTRLRAFFKHSPNLIFMKDPQGRYLYVNQEVERVLRITEERIKGKRDDELFPQEQAAAYQANDRRVLQAGIPMEFEEIFVKEDGPHTTIVHKFPMFNAEGGIYAIGGVATDITERIQEEAALRYSEERYRVVVETASDAVVSIDESGDIRLANPATAIVFSYEPSELIGQPLTILMPEYLRPLHTAGFKRYLNTSQRHMNWRGTELMGLRKNGEEFPVEVSFGELTKNGRRVFTGFIRDISGRKRAEEALRETEERFKKMADTAPVMIWASGPDKRCTYFNQQWLDFTGRTMQQELGDGWADGVHEEDLQRCLQTYVSAFDRREPFRMEYRLRRADGQFRWIYDTGTPRLSPGGEFLGYIGSCVDITERKTAEEALQRSEERWRSVFENSAIGVALTDLKGRFLATNHVYQRMLGYTEEELRALSFLDLTHEDYREANWALVTELLEGKRRQFQIEKKYRRKDESLIWVSNNVSLVPGTERVPRFIMALSEDITERKRTESALRGAQAELARVSKIADMGELTASIAHEINQPLAAVVTDVSASLRYLAQQPPNLEEASGALIVAIREANRASDVIARIRALLRKTPPPMQRLDARQVIQEVLALAREELVGHGITVTTELAADLPAVLGDRIQLQQLLLNLILNGIDAMSTITDRPRNLLIRSAHHPDGVLIQVQDSGKGVDPVQADRIFEPFFTTKPQGTGMGLAISRSIVEAHGGHLWVASASPHGTIFQFTLKTVEDRRD